MMKRVTSSLLCLLLAVLLLGGVANAISYDESLEYTPNPERVINIVAFDYDVLTNGTADEIEYALYPSGMILPTKYGDFLDFIPFEGVSYCDYVSDFLWEYYPTPGNNYTYAEYCAAKRFCFLAKATAIGNGDIYKAIKQAERYDVFSITNSLSNFRLGETENFHNVTAKFKDFMLYAASTDNTYENYPLYPELFVQQDEGFYLSFGFCDMYDMSKCSNALTTYGRVSFADALLTQKKYYEYFSLVQEIAQIKADVSLESSYDVNLIDKETNNYVHPCTVASHVELGELITTVDWIRYNDAMDARNHLGIYQYNPEEQFDDEPSQEEFERYMAEMGITSSSSEETPSAVVDGSIPQSDGESSGNDATVSAADSDQSQDAPSVTGEKSESSSLSEEYMASASSNFETGVKHDESLSPADSQHNYNAQDILTVVAIFFVIGSIGAFWIGTWIHKRNDPSRSWKK